MQFRQRPTSASSLALPLDTLLTGGYGEIALRNRTPVLEPEGHWTRGRSVGAARSQRAGRSPRLNVRPVVASPKQTSSGLFVSQDYRPLQRGGRFSKNA